MLPFNAVAKITAVGCVAALAFAGVVSAEDTTTTSWQDITVIDGDHEQLRDTLVTAEAVVEQKEAVVDQKADDVAAAEADLAAAEAAAATAADDVAAAEQAVADAEQVVADAETALEQAQDDLANAILVKNAAQLAYSVYTCSEVSQSPTQQLCRANRATALNTLNAAGADVTTAQGDVTSADADLAAAQADLEAAKTDLATAEGVKADADAAVTAAGTALKDAQEELATAQSELSTATADRDAAKTAFVNYVPPVEDVVVQTQPPHPGCNGLANAQVQVAKSTNSKGKAADTLAAVATKMGC